jgi:hypothetical protein
MEIQRRPRRGVESDYVIKQIQRVAREKTNIELSEQRRSAGILLGEARKALDCCTFELPDRRVLELWDEGFELRRGTSPEISRFIIDKYAPFGNITEVNKKRAYWGGGIPPKTLPYRSFP